MAADITLKVNGTEIQCSRHTLMEKSDYFRGMFSCNMKESESDVVELKGCKVDVIQFLVMSLTSTVEVTEESMYDVVEGAVMFQFTEVLDLCCVFMQKVLCHSNCLNIMAVADMFSLDATFNKAKSHALWYFENVAKEGGVCDLPRNEMVDYLSHDGLNCVSEMSVFEVLCRWYEHNVDLDCKVDHTEVKVGPTEVEDEDLVLQKGGNQRLNSRTAACESSESFRHLLAQCVYLDELSESQLELVQTHALVKDDIDAVRAVTEAIQKQSKKYRSSAQFHCRKPSTNIFCFGGDTCSGSADSNQDRHGDEKLGPSESVLWFCPEQCTFQPIALQPDTNTELGQTALQMFGCQVTLVGNEVFVTGGIGEVRRSRWQVFMMAFDCLTSRWSRKQDLQHPRRHHATCVKDSRLFLIGGFGRNRDILNHVECYDVNTDEWIEHTAMLQPEFSPAAAVHGDYLYVFKSQIQQYRLATREWSFITISHQVTSNVSFAMTYQDSIYLCSQFHKTLRVFHPESEEFQDVGGFQNEAKGCVLHHGKIYWFEDTSDEPTVEVFDLRRKSFEVVGKTRHVFIGRELVVAPRYPHFHPAALAKH